MAETQDGSDGDVPEGRCGYTFPKNFDPNKINQYKPNSCARPPLPDTDQCVIHADPDKTEQKLKELRSRPVGGSLDGAILPDEFGDIVNFEDVSLLRGADLSGVDLGNVDLSD
jgi:hypothetical protein